MGLLCGTTETDKRHLAVDTKDSLKSRMRENCKYGSEEGRRQQCRSSTQQTIKFEWDPNKNEINKKKHGLSFETAREVFYDEFAILFDDPDHSDEEDRFLIIGETKTEQICIVSHCYRDNENVVRIISARRATRAEQRTYLDGI